MTQFKTSEEKDIEFISTFNMYAKEESGIKANTVRDIKFYDKAKNSTHIRIRKGYTSTFFRRKITDVSIWGDEIIISWIPENWLSKEEHEKLINEQIEIRKKNDEVFQNMENNLNHLANHCLKNHIPKEKVEEFRKEIDYRKWGSSIEITDLFDLINKILLGEK